MLFNKITADLLKLANSVLLIIFLATGTASWAQEVDSLNSFLKEAAYNNPGLQVKYSEYLASLEKIPQAASLPDPEVQFSFFIKPMEIIAGKQVADFRLMQMAPWFGTLKAAKDEASKMAVAKFEEAQSVKNELFLQVKIAWYQVFRTWQEIELTKRNLDLLRSMERMALVNFQAAEVPEMAGSGGMIDLLKVQMEIGKEENRLKNLQDQLVTDKARFNTYLNRGPDREVFLTDSIAEASLPATLAFMADSLENNPMIKMYRAEKEAKEARIIMTTRMGYPMVGVGLNYSVIQKRPDGTSMMNGRDMIMPMVTATLPIYRKKYDALQREAAFLRDAAEESSRNVRNQLVVSYQEALQLFRDASRRMELYRSQSSLAEHALNLLKTKFSVAGTAIDEILKMQEQWLDYQFKGIDARVDQNIAVAKLVSITSSN